MPVNERYRKQVALLIQTIPAVPDEKDFALKGGTAINLFVRDMPRLSVDIDLTYLPSRVAGQFRQPIQAAIFVLQAIDPIRSLLAVRLNRKRETAG